MKPPNTLLTFFTQHKKTLLLILIVSTATILTTTAISTWLSRHYNLRFPTIGTITTIGVEAYWDPTLQNQTTTIQWGTIYPGTTNNATIYLQSISNIPTILTLTTTNWTFINTDNQPVTEPSPQNNNMTLTWNYNQTLLNPLQTTQVTLTLTAKNNREFIMFLINNNIKTFNFDIIITATPP